MNKYLKNQVNNEIIIAFAQRDLKNAQIQYDNDLEFREFVDSASKNTDENFNKFLEKINNEKKTAPNLKSVLIGLDKLIEKGAKLIDSISFGQPQPATVLSNDYPYPLYKKEYLLKEILQSNDSKYDGIYLELQIFGMEKELTTVKQSVKLFFQVRGLEANHDISIPKIILVANGKPLVTISPANELRTKVISISGSNLELWKIADGSEFK